MPDEPRWRQDFPVEWEDDKYVTRREFAKFLVLGSLALFVGNVSIALRHLLKKIRPPVFPQVLVVREGELPAGGVKLFRYPTAKDACMLICLAPGAYAAYSQKCTHLSCAVTFQKKDGKIHCPCHNGVFDLGSGAPLAGPPQRRLPRILLEAKGRELWATGVEL